MKGKNDKLILPESQAVSEEEGYLPGYPAYAADEDIYYNCQEEKDINPEDLSRIKKPTLNFKAGKMNEKDFEDDFSGSDLDIPGSELDDELEMIGSEDEENNYYSLGGDDHEDLEENHES